MVLLLNRLNMAATRIIQNSAIMVVNGRTGQAGLLSNDLADKGVQRIIIFDPHKVVNNVTSPDGDYCRNCRHLKTHRVMVIRQEQYFTLNNMQYIKYFDLKLCPFSKVL